VNRNYLERVASSAGGKAYFLTEPQGLEQLLLRDVLEHTGSTTVERPLAPEVLKHAEILNDVGMESAPMLKGYVRFTSKPTAETILQLDRHDPLLARWQYGLGRAAVFASDAKTRWAADWVAWKGFDKFWTNLCRDLLPRAQGGEAAIDYDSANGDLVVEYRLGRGVPEPDKIPDVYAFGPDGFQQQVPVKKIAAGTFRGRLPIGSRQGLFRVRPAEESRAFPEAGLYRPETELSDYGSNDALLKQVAAYTGGRFQPEPAAVFSGGGRSISSSRLRVYGVGYTKLTVNFEQEVRQLQDTAVVMAEIQRRQAEVQKLQAENVVYMQEGMRLHEQRMAHVDMRLAEITDKLDGLMGFMGGYFKGTQ
jgi:Ca-activated chloride channel homolog